MFSNLVENDTVWPAIVSAAKSDLDFRRWLLKNSVNYTSFSDVDWINQYAQWAKWPGYDSEWASRNHDLLLWVVETTPWMNILTPDRPIDSPRYVVMQSVAGNEMKFIYPDLFKVEVYSNSWKDKNWNNKQVLLTPSEIKNNLIKYLSWKVDEYNTIVEKECNNALSMNIYFQQLKKLNYSLATPDKTLHSCGRPFNYKEFVQVFKVIIN